MANQKYHAFTFSVEGAGVFPIDMLRYDRCVPYASEDVSLLSDLAGQRLGQRRVKLIAYFAVGSQLRPTVDRWRSFGWVVDERSIQGIST